MDTKPMGLSSCTNPQTRTQETPTHLHILHTNQKEEKMFPDTVCQLEKQEQKGFCILACNGLLEVTSFLFPLDKDVVMT